MKILITGVNRGIGHALAQIYLNSGAQVIGTSRKKENLFSHSNFQHIELDMLQESSWAQFRQQITQRSHLDLVLNNAGVLLDGSLTFEQLTAETLRKTFEVNVLGPHQTTQAALPLLLKSQKPKVVSISSLMGSITDNSSGRYYAYRTSKTALNMWNKSFSIDYPQITSIVVHPGWVQTDMGGSQAPLSTVQSAEGIWSVIENIKPQKTGQFFDYRGNELPW